MNNGKTYNSTNLCSYDHIFIFGPLSLDCYRHRAYIVPNTEILFSSGEFYTLHLLAAREDIILSFEQIYNAVWEREDGNDRRDEAVKVVNDLVKKINTVGNGFVWIENNPPRGFTFRTKWAHNREKWGG